MNQTTNVVESFFITFRDSQYPCKAINRNGTVLYQVNFNKSYLYLTQATNSDGVIFWTTVPEDQKLKPILQELGDEIENHFM